MDPELNFNYKYELTINKNQIVDIKMIAHRASSWCLTPPKVVYVASMEIVTIIGIFAPKER